MCSQLPFPLFSHDVESTDNESLPTMSSARELAVYLMSMDWRRSGEFNSWWNDHAA